MDSLKSRLAGRVKTAVGAAECTAESKDWRCYFDLVDHFRQLPQEAKAAAVVDAPPSTGDIRLDALLASMVIHLCDEAGVPKPDWSTSADFRLEATWFVTDLKRMHKYALAQSPEAFRRNNIFVLGNFMDRC